MMQEKEYHKEYKIKLKKKQMQGEKMQDKYVVSQRAQNETEGETEPIIFYLY